MPGSMFSSYMVIIVSALLKVQIHDVSVIVLRCNLLSLEHCLPKRNSPICPSNIASAITERFRNPIPPRILTFLALLFTCPSTELLPHPSTVLGDQPFNTTITRSLSSIRATVVEVTYKSIPTSSLMIVVLKLYDRRFGTTLRKVRQLSMVRERQYLPHTSPEEHSHQSYVRCGGKAAKLWEEIEAD